MWGPVSLQQILSTLLVLGAAAAVSAQGECPAECSCAPLPPPCPLGVSWATDRCGCCKVCARQLNEDCGGAAEPCDHIKGLRCHLGAGGDPRRGLCRAEAQGLPCAFAGRLYQHGEDFQPHCQHRCTCMDGVVGCTPPGPRPQGGCCDEWLCDDDDDDNRISEEPADPAHAAPPDRRQLPPPHNHISAVLQGPSLSRGATHREAASSPTSEVLLPSGCVPQTTAWTECSATCGMGVSSRVTNSNPGCRLARETRLCQVRQCELQLPVAAKRGRKCQRTVRPQQPIRVTFAGCSTPRRYRPRSCGTCSDGRCCAPSLSRTVRLHFLCPDGGEAFSRDVMWIQRCSCREACRPGGGAPWPPLSLHNDIHTF